MGAVFGYMTRKPVGLRKVIDGDILGLGIPGTLREDRGGYSFAVACKTLEGDLSNTNPLRTSHRPHKYPNTPPGRGLIYRKTCTPQGRVLRKR